MMEAYGRAVVAERTRPRHLQELAAYLRQEYGPGTEPGYVLADGANGGRPPAPPAGNGGALRALANALRALVPGNGSKTANGATVR